MTDTTYRRAVRIRVLGPVRASDDLGVELALGGPQQRFLLALLVAARGETISADQLVDQIWGDEAPPSARKTLQVYIHRLRSQLGDVIETVGNGYRLDGVVTDVAVFEDLHTTASRPGTDPARAAELLREALALWDGLAYADVRDALALVAEVGRLEDRRVAVLADRFEADLALGRHAAIVGEIEGAVREFAFQERFRRQLMVALHRSGRQVEALRAFEQYRRYLGDELGLEPTSELRELERRILADDPDLLGDFDPAEASIARTVRGYEIREQIAHGHETETFRAYHRSMGREVRLRVLGATLADNAEFIATFLQNTKEVAAIDHPNLGFIYDTWREPGRAFQVGRWFEGGSLVDRHPLAQAAALTMLEQVGGALAAAHRSGVTHGRLTASNVLFDSDGAAHLTDFSVGVAPSSVSDDIRAFAALAESAVGGGAPAGVAAVFELAASGDYTKVTDLLRALRQAMGVDGVGVADPATANDGSRSAVRNPFKGLQAFQEADAEDFFGRDGLVERVVDRLERGRLVAVVGPSGSGKSSLVKAGVLPELRRRSTGSQLVTEMFPGAYPFEELESSLLRVGVNRTSIIGDLLADDRGLLRVIKQIVPSDDSEVVLVIDQFEELFSMVDDERTRRLFLENLRTAVADPRSQLRIVLTMRADFFDRPLRYPDFGALVEANLVPVTVPGEDDLAQVIAQPAAGVGVSFAAGVISRIAHDVAGEAGGLPLLQYALTELFDHRTDDQITMADYERVGGVLGALGKRAEQLYADLSPGGQTAIRQALLRMVTVEQGIDDLRRRVLQSELRSLDSDAGDVDRAVQQFGSNRLLTFDLDPGSRGPTVEIAHEALVREWPRLAGWIDEQSTDLALRRRLDAAIDDWSASGADDSYLLRGGRLAQFEDWSATTTLALTGTERQFIAESAAREQVEADKRAARRRRLTLGLSIVAGALAVLSVFALVQRQRAVDSAEQAETDRLAATGAAMVSSNSQVGLLLAVEAHRRDPSISTLGALQSALLDAGPALQFFGDGALDVEWVEGGIVMLRRDAVVLYDHDGNERTRIEVNVPIENESINGGERFKDGLPWPFGVRPDAKQVVVLDVGSGSTVVDFDDRDRTTLPIVGATAYAYSNDGSILAVGTDDREVLLFDSSTLVEIERVVLPDTERSYADYPEFVQASGSFPAVEAWDLRGVGRIVFAPDDDRFAVGVGPRVRQYDAETLDEIGDGALLSTWDFGFPYSPAGFEFDGERIRAQGYQTVTVLDAATMTVEAVEAIPTGRAFGDLTARVTKYRSLDDGRRGVAAFSDGRLLFFTAGPDGEAELLQDMNLPVSQTEGLALSPIDDRYVLSGVTESYFGSLVGQTLLSDTVAGHPTGIYHSISHDGNVVSSSDSFDDPVVWDRSGAAPVRVEPTRDVLQIAIDNGSTNPDWGLEARTVSATETWFGEQAVGRIDLFPNADLNADPIRIENVWYTGRISPDGKWYAHVRCTGGDDFGPDFFNNGGSCDFRGVNVVDLATGGVVAELLLDNGVSGFGATSSIDWSVDSQLLFIVNGFNVREFVAGEWEEVNRFTTSTGTGDDEAGELVMVARASPNGEDVALVTLEGELIIVDLETGAELRRLAGGTSYSASGGAIAPDPWFSADGTLMVTAYDDRVRIWDVDSGEQLGSTLPNDPGVIAGGADGEHPQVVTKVDGQLHIWNLDSDTWADVACQAVGRNMTRAEWEQFGPRDTDYHATCPQFPIET